MRAVVQRVSEATVTVDGRATGSIGPGLLVLVGAGEGDGEADVDYIARKIADLRVFEDADGRLNRSVEEAGGAVLVVSQFTLYGDCRTGRRPSFSAAMRAEAAQALVESLCRRLRDRGLQVATGEFRAMMNVTLVARGPVTLLLDSRKTF